MYENLSYEKLKELPCEQKKNALMELKERYPQYKEMAEMVGGTPAALANLYLRIVEGRKFGRRKRDEAQAVSENTGDTVILKKRTKLTAAPVPDLKAARTENKQYDEMIVLPPKKSISFTICLDAEETGAEAKCRLDGIIGSMLHDKVYRTHLSIEEVRFG